MLKYSSLLALSIPLILCNKVFKCTEDFTLGRRFIHESFNKLETNDIMSYLEPKVKPLPNIGGILNKHRHILYYNIFLV